MLRVLRTNRSDFFILPNFPCLYKKRSLSASRLPEIVEILLDKSLQIAVLFEFQLQSFLSDVNSRLIFSFKGLDISEKRR